MSDIGPIWEGDDLVIRVTVEEDGAAKDISGATIEARAVSGADSVTPTINEVDLSAGRINVVFAEDDLADGYWTLSVRVTLGSITQTVGVYNITVNKSVFA